MQAVEHADSEEDTFDETDESDDQNSITIKVSGCTYGTCQDNLKMCRDEGKRLLSLPVKLEAEPENVVDSNAITFKVFVKGEWRKIGYVGLPHIPRVKKAIDDDSIINVSISSIMKKTLPSLKTYLKGFCNILKSGKWAAICLNNVYNKPL